jgi:membrane protein
VGLLNKILMKAKTFTVEMLFIMQEVGDLRETAKKGSSMWKLLKETFQEWNEDKAPRLAAALAYYTIFSIAPLLVLVIAITGFIVGSNTTIRDQVITQVQGLVGQQGANAISQLIQQTGQPRNGILASVIGIVTLLFGATGLFGQLQGALNTIWDVQPKPGRGIGGVVKDRFLSFTLVLGLCFLLLVSLVISAALSILNGYFSSLLGGAGILAQVINFIISTAVITLIFAMIFKILPDVEIRWGDVWIGAVVTALLFSIGKGALGLYLGRSAAASAYGAAGSLVVLLLWVYYSAQILFLGAEFTQVYARRAGSRVASSKNPQPIQENKESGYAREAGGQSMIPVAGQPVIHAESRPVGAPRDLVSGRTRIQYEPANPASVVPVIALGAVAAVYTAQRVIRRILPY